VTIVMGPTNTGVTVDSAYVWAAIFR
jgi:hypothetical protein